MTLVHAATYRQRQFSTLNLQPYVFNTFILGNVCFNTDRVGGVLKVDTNTRGEKFITSIYLVVRYIFISVRYVVG